MSSPRNDCLDNRLLPVDVVLHPSWWFHHEGITFDEDFFFHPARRVEVERKMEQVLHDRWGRFGVGEGRDADVPWVGPVHLAAGYLTSEMLGCRVDYFEDAPPPVIPPSNIPNASVPIPVLMAVSVANAAIPNHEGGIRPTALRHNPFSAAGAPPL